MTANAPNADDRALARTLRTGWLLLAVSLPLGVTLEALHGFKVQAYLASEMRRELWRLAHAHGTLLGILCLVFVAVAERHVAAPIRPSVARLLRWGAVLMPLGFFLGGVLNSEGDPSFGILLVPIGALLLVVALVRCAIPRSSRS
jgi:Na+-driven multidrug efflux pump